MELHIIVPPSKGGVGGGNIVFSADPLCIRVIVASFPCIIFWTSG